MELADELLAMAEKVKDPKMLLSAHWARGTTLLELGELVSANEHHEKSLAVFDLRQPLPDPQAELRRVASLGQLYLGLYQLGYPDRVWVKSREALGVAKRSSIPQILAVASSSVAQYNLVRGDGTAAQKHAEEAMAFIEAFGLQSLSPLTITANGGALIAQGRYEEGIAGMRRGISAFRASGATPPAWMLSFLASGPGRIGRRQEGLEVVEEGFAFAAKTGQQLNITLLHHVKGELLLVQNPSGVAEAQRCFRTAIEIARRQSARTEELRATTSLARLLTKQGKRDEARAMLAGNLRLVHRGLRHRRPKECQGAARQTERLDAFVWARRTFRPFVEIAT
jgi:tetratricopeptide (TPR) repeat protein